MVTFNRWLYFITIMVKTAVGNCGFFHITPKMAMCVFCHK